MRLAWAGVAALALAQGPPGVFLTDVPAHGIDVIQARPTERSITLSLMAEKDSTGSFSYEPGGGKRLLTLKAGVPLEFEVAGLAADRDYRYAVEAGGTTVEGTFRTGRGRDEPFQFAVQADSHLDGGTDGRIYAKSLNGMVSDKCDFLVDLGDTFMTDKYPAYQDAVKQYVAQRYYLGLVGRTMPVFLTLGNHDGEAGWRSRGGDMTAWSSGMRKKYFPPVSIDKNYYAWTRGDGLFVVLDPFAETGGKPRSDEDGWKWTLGLAQYDWLRATLAGSRAPYRFVFIHHLVGGKGKEARGGAEASAYFEWGGANLDGTRGFETQRPGWAMPIHDLLVANGVAVVFHGHDHMYVKQDRDGLVYQEVPQPSHARGDATRNAAEYGYLSGKVLGSSGYLRTSLGNDQAVVEYVRNGEVADRYLIEKGARR